MIFWSFNVFLQLDMLEQQNFTSFLNNIFIGLYYRPKGFYVFYWNKNTKLYIFKLREVFPRGETVLKVHAEWKLMKSCFSVKFMRFFEKKWHMSWSKGTFLYFWRDLKIFLNPRLSLIVHLIIQKPFCKFD